MSRNRSSYRAHRWAVSNHAMPWCLHVPLSLVLFLAAGLAVTSGCSRGNSVPDALRSPMLFFAIDGLEWEVMQPLLADGKLPAIEALMRAGTFGYLESMKPTYSPVIWTTIATGKYPQKHGIRHFIYETRRGFRYYTSGHRKTKAFWNILSDYGLSVSCFGWWMTYPAEPINGMMVSQTNTTGVLRDPQRALWKGALLRGVEGQVHPPEKQNEIMELLEDVDSSLDEITADIFGEWPHPMTPFSELMWDQTLWAFRADAVYARATIDLVRSGEPFDLVSIYIGGPDVSAHRFWRYAYPENFEYPPSAEQIENFSTLIDNYYAYADRVIGEIVRAAPEGTAVMIVSDHGMHTINAGVVFNVDDLPNKTNSAHHLDAPPGVFIAAGGPFRNGTSVSDGEPLDLGSLEKVGGVLDILPTLLAAKGVRLGKDLDGVPMLDVLTSRWRSRSEVRYVDSHDTREWLDARDDRIRQAVDQTERLEQLRSLGYIK